MTRRVVHAAIAAVVVLSVTREATAQIEPQIRVGDRELKAALALGVARSPTLASLVEQLQAVSVVLYVNCDMQLPGRLQARLNLVTSVRGVRYVQIRMSCAAAVHRLIATLAHEMQHALEIGRRVDIVDVDAMESFYEDIGFQTFAGRSHRKFETDAAIAVERQVQDDLRRRPRAPREKSSSGSGPDVF